MLKSTEVVTSNGLGRVKNENVSSENHGQKILDKVTKLSKIGFSMKCFTASFSQFCSTNFKICLMDGPLGTRY